MSIKVAGADDVDDFARMLQTGESQHEEIGPDRLMMDTLFREDRQDPMRKWDGNFMQGVDEFDHRFFKKSPREAATMDPQKRLFLQAAYQAVESSGYITETAYVTRNTSVSTWGLVQPTVSTTQHVTVPMPLRLRATSKALYQEKYRNTSDGQAPRVRETPIIKPFPTLSTNHEQYANLGMVKVPLDTAFSASAVAIHTACPNILSGECTAALAGGVAANLDPPDISFVEAHGTGTPVGDPTEYESIRTALAGPSRRTSLPIGSVKGHIGHTEGASVTSLQPWPQECKAALINNYGASGSNASIIVMQNPQAGAVTNTISATMRTITDAVTPQRLPFGIAGLDVHSISVYCAKLAAQSNRSLANAFVFSCRSTAELIDTLERACTSPTEVGIGAIKAERPVILCFGGQVSTFVGLDLKLYDSVALLRQTAPICRTTLEITSVSGPSDNQPQTHVEARLHIRTASDPTYHAEFARFDRLVSYERCVDLLRLGVEDIDQDHNDVDVLRGRNVYRAFDEIVHYHQLYRGVKTVVGYRGETAGRVVCMHSTSGAWLDVPLSDNFSQVAGIWVNCMTDRDDCDMYFATGCEKSMRSPHAAAAGEERDNNDDSGPAAWHVFAWHKRQTEKLYISDVFVFDARTGMLAEIMLGIQYARVSKASMVRLLTRWTADESKLVAAAKKDGVGLATQMLSWSQMKPGSYVDTGGGSGVAKGGPPAPQTEKTSATGLERSDITDDVRNLVSSVTGVEASEIGDDSALADFGIDSLMGMELAREVGMAFECTLDQMQLMGANPFRSFVVCISNTLFGDEDKVHIVPGPPMPWDITSTRMKKNGFEDYNDSTTTSSEDVDTGVFTPREVFELKHASARSLKLELADILQSFEAVKSLSDQRIREYHLDNTAQVVIAATNRLCVALVLEAFDELGWPLRTAKAGDVLPCVSFAPKQEQLMEFVFSFLSRDARLVNIDPASSQITRTHIAAPRISSKSVLQELLDLYPEFAIANNLTYYAGKHLAGVLTGKTDGISVLLGSVEGRRRVEALYCEHTFNRMNYS
ncbi:hypothetical protein M406DRAFT_76083 [Cryphonectria parasitica EP155]|uniref:Carrier domain-containing protein n=1 Tax=Cryphonectria parasitica (strain ATCC 38755 / EP155) TaxID=660469 RepID=A0A9P5CIB4_CRYP1|nr:uncharacterized protein M406DRAFT_76083 [Cryphonectria parasitica EP155]KAF3760428.1 hypothetical protein M406DRAFT_76083 [Cryphonectria parasitica EP155]